MFEVKDVRCEYLFNPIGIGVKEPRISWKLASDQRSVKQKSYQIQVALDTAFQPVIWDSGEVGTDQNLHVVLNELEVVSRKRYYYRIRVTNQKNETTAWSPVSYFEMGLLNKADWRAEWIAPPTGINGNPCPKVAHEFVLDRPIKSARLYATALGLYELNLNGKRVGDAYFTPGWTSYQERLQYQTYDVTDMLSSGRNELNCLLGNGWYKGRFGWEGKSNLYGDRLGLLAQLHVELENGKEVIISTDEGWKVTESPILTSEIYHGETYDGSKEEEASAWRFMEVIPYSKDILIAQENVPVRITDILEPVKIIRTPKGEVVIDMGQNMVGWVRFSIRGNAGQQVEIQHAEVLDSDGNFYIDNLRAAEQTNRYILKGKGMETFEPHFTFQGFRYIKLLGFKKEQVVLDHFKGIVLHSDMEMTGTFQCSDSLVNQLQHNILWSLKGNFLDVPTDCPQRNERLGWTGDAQIFIRTASFLANTAPFFTKWLRDLKVEQNDEDGVPFIVPNILNEGSNPEVDGKSFSAAAWGDAAVICPWTLYIVYGDTRILEEQYESMKSWVSYIYKQGDNPYLWNTGFQLGDWLALDAKPDSYVGATDNEYIATAFYAYSTSLVKKTARVLGYEKDFAYYEDLERKIVEVLSDEFITPSGRLAVPTQTGQILALMFNLLDDHAKTRAVSKLEELLEESDYHLTTGFVGTPYLNHVLSENGLNDAAYKLLFQEDYPSWLYQITKGATTIWEHWDGIKEDGSFWSADMNSFNHYAYGAIGDWLYRKVAGIELEESNPAYKHLSIRPHIGEGFDWVEGKLESMNGTIRSYWKKDINKVLTMEVSIPPNTTATIWLPYAEVETVLESGNKLDCADGIERINPAEDGVLLTVTSGEYFFRY